METTHHPRGRLLRVSEAADVLGVDPYSVRRMIRRGDLEAVRLGPRIGSPIRISPDALNAFLQPVVDPEEGDE